MDVMVEIFARARIDIAEADEAVEFTAYKGKVENRWISSERLGSDTMARKKARAYLRLIFSCSSETPSQRTAIPR